MHLESAPYSLQTNAPVEETRKKVWLVDSKVVRADLVLLSYVVLFLSISFHFVRNSFAGTDCQFPVGITPTF